MKLKQIKWRLKNAIQYFPFTLNSLLAAALTWLTISLLYKPVHNNNEDQPALLPFIVLMGKIAIWAFVGLVAVSVVSTFVCWLRFIWLSKHKGVSLKLSFNVQARKGKPNKLFMNASLEKAWRPFLGFVKGRIVYDDFNFSDRFALLSKANPDIGTISGISGRSRLLLPDIKEYDLKGGYVYFQDMLHLFSLVVPQDLSGHFYQPPVLLGADERDVAPKKTETLDIRIEQLRRVEGEYLNYKDFEAGDDVRRIVWKVYAKNRELVVRIPEMFEPYASHLHLYASFYENVKLRWGIEGYMREMLNYYKNCVWTVYDTLAQKDWHVSLISDQQFTVAESTDDDERTARIISNSSWHNDRSPNDYFNVKTGAVLCISSLTDINDLAQLLERCDPSTVIYFVKVSNRLKHFAPLNWLYRMLFLPPQDQLSRLRTTWSFSPFRLEVVRREKAIRELLKKSDVIWGEL